MKRVSAKISQKHQVMLAISEMPHLSRPQHGVMGQRSLAEAAPYVRMIIMLTISSLCA